MAEVRPFRGLRYDPARVALRDVVTPPYDIVSSRQAAALAASSPYSSILLDLPTAFDSSDPYRTAAELLAAWRREGVLVRDPLPAFYALEQVFQGPDGRTRTRTGFIGLVRLDDAADRVILPHEKTHAAPRIDRLELLRATRANLSPVFLVYDDPGGAVGAALAAAPPTQPLVAIEGDDKADRLRPVGGEAAARVAHVLADARFYIADGHHRYETAMAFRDERAAQGDDDAGYLMAYFCDVHDPGLAIFPTHRLLKGIAVPPADDVVARLRPSFEIVSDRGADPQTADLALREVAHSSVGSGEIGLYFPAERRVVRVKVRGDAPVSRLVCEGLSRDSARLAVAHLHLLILRDALGVDPAATEGRIDYVSDVGQMFELLAGGGYTLAACVPPTAMDDVIAVAERGETMPHKSTYFYPKPGTGLVFHIMGD